MLFQGAACVMFPMELWLSRSHSQAQSQCGWASLQGVDVERQVWGQECRHSARTGDRQGSQLTAASCWKDFSPAYSFMFAVAALELNMSCILIVFVV